MTNAISKYLMQAKYKIALFLLLLFVSLFSIGLEIVHARVNGFPRYAMLIWNLFLAWIPLIAAGIAYLASWNKITFYIIMPISTLVWLAFFPNAPYLLTDFQHLANPGGGAPIWFDVILLIWFALTGLLLGLVSLQLMQEIVSRIFSPVLGWGFAIVVTIMSSIGIYLGRFLRWNSWDLLSNPIPIAYDMASIVRHPISNKATYVFTILFTLLFLFVYLALHLFAGVIREQASRKP